MKKTELEENKMPCHRNPVGLSMQYHLLSVKNIGKSSVFGSLTIFIIVGSGTKLVIPK